MTRTEHHVPPLPALVAVGLAVWTVLLAAYASVRHGYYAPAVLQVALLVLAAVLFCTNAARHNRRRQ